MSDNADALVRTLRLTALIVVWGTIAAVSVGHVVALVEGAVAGDTARVGLDYRAFVAAGELVRTGNGSLIYEPMSDAFLRLADVGFVYPPWAALFFVPWSVISVEIGLVLWTVLGVGGMVVAMRVAGAGNWWFFAAILITFPSVFALGLGQSAHHLVAMTALSFALAARRSEMGTGLGVAASAWKPHLLGGWVLLASSRPGRWRRVASAAAVATVTLVVLAGLTLPGSWRAWWDFLVGSVDDLASSVMEASLPGMVALLWGSTSAVRYLIVALVASVVVPLAVVLLRRSDASLAERFAFATAVWLLLVPHVVVYDVLLLAVPLGILVMGRFRRDVVVAGSALAFALSVGPILVEAQLDAFGRAVDVSTLGLVFATMWFGAWVVRDGPVLEATPIEADPMGVDRRGFGTVEQ